MKNTYNLYEKKNNKISRKESKGITLIALVITIIVLLILAGVIIATLTGDNRTITKSWRSKKYNFRSRRIRKNTTCSNGKS